MNVPDAVSSDLLETLEDECRAAESPRPFAALAEARRLSGDPEGAAAVVRLGLEAFPAHLTMHLVLARALIELGDSAGAREHYTFVFKRDAANEEAATFLGMREPELEEETPEHGAPAEEPLSLSAELLHLSELFAAPGGPKEGPPQAIATLTLAEIYARQGLADKAIEVCEAMLARDPDDTEAADRLREYRRQLTSIET